MEDGNGRIRFLLKKGPKLYTLYTLVGCSLDSPRQVFFCMEVPSRGMRVLAIFAFSRYTPYTHYTFTYMIYGLRWPVKRYEDH
jgi:hypothetical protein